MNHRRASIKQVPHCSVPVTIDITEGMCWYKNMQEEWEALLCKREQASLQIHLTLPFLWNCALLQIQHEDMPILIGFH